MITCPVCANAELRYIPDTSEKIGTSPDTWQIMCYACHARFHVPRPDPAGNMPPTTAVDGAEVAA